MDREQSVQHFLDLLKKSRRGNFKIYIGMIAGVGKSYRMLSDAHQLLESGIDVKIGYIETHGRVETEALVGGLPIIPRRKIFYKGKEIEEMDLQSILSIHPEVVIVDELAHTNVEGSKNEKRWQDVMDILDAGISVITAVNIQHIEGLNEMVQDVVGIEVKERIPDIVLEQADEALNNFFKAEHILQLRELALKEVALRVEKKVENTIPENLGVRHERFMACISSNEKTPRKIIRKVARLATRYNSKFFVLYVQTPRESSDRIPLASQRHLLNHFKLATELGGEIIQVQSPHITDAIVQVCKEKQISTLCIGRPALKYPSAILAMVHYRNMLEELAQLGIDLIILA